ncbi:MAG: response regulator transcription factor [Planctomycetaceae bacterium]
MSRRRVLVVEDDAAIRRGIVDALEYEGYQPLEAERGDAGLRTALSGAFDLVLLDLVLPGLGGLDVLREVRLARPTLPVIILTARGEEADRVQGLKLGADDYVVKPFSVRELTARVEAVLRRSAERPGDIAELPLPHAVADFNRREVRFEDGTAVELTEREADTLRYLAVNAGRVVSRDELMTRVWGVDPQGLNSRAIDMQIARLREKLGGEEPSQLIRTVRGKGYLFAREIETE